MAEATLATDDRRMGTVGSLIAEMRTRLLPSLGAEADSGARELLAALADRPRHWAVIARDEPVSADAWSRALEATTRRARGAPAQYAAGLASFRHLTLAVDERVLIPRPETEQLVELVLRLVARTSAGSGTAVDVGTGSGAIALALASEGSFARVIATDVSLDALAVARVNVQRCAGELRAPVELRHGSLLSAVPERGVGVVVSNPPYIRLDEAASLPSSVRDWEPAIALFSGDGGMGTTAALIKCAARSLAPGGLLALEVDARRGAHAAALLASHGAYGDVRTERDFTGRERFVVARRLEEQG